MKKEKKNKKIYIVHKKDTYEIFAYTNDSKIMKIFKESRNIDNFIFRKNNGTNSDYNEYIRNIPFLELVLFTGKTIVDDKIENFTLSITKLEKKSFDSSLFRLKNIDLEAYSLDKYCSFKDKYIGYLDSLLYYDEKCIGLVDDMLEVDEMKLIFDICYS